MTRPPSPTDACLFWRLLVVMGVLFSGTGLLAQTGDGFEKASMAWRTALHFDPGAEVPLRSLVELYQKEGRVAELLRLYTQHLAQYPQDENAKAVLARLYVVLKEARAEVFLQEALTQHPQSALLRHVQAEWLAQSYDARAIEALDTAVKLETKVPARRAQWLGELIKAASEAGRGDVVEGRLRELGKDAAFTAEQRLQWARRCLEAGLKSSAMAALAGGDFSALTGEAAVEARFVQGRVALGNGQRAEASAHAIALLDLLAADHWRRKEALLLHWQTADEKQRATALTESEAAWKAAPANESLAVSCGDVLIMAGKRDEALRVWKESLEVLPTSRLIEDRIIDLFQNMRREEELLVFIAERVRLQPEREDLRMHHARRLLQLGRVDDGLRALAGLLEKSDAAQRVTTHLQTARWLRLQNLFGDLPAGEARDGGGEAFRSGDERRCLCGGENGGRAVPDRPPTLAAGAAAFGIVGEAQAH
jgi:tetratricopeptide (TPR) repeat protein